MLTINIFYALVLTVYPRDVYVSTVFVMASWVGIVSKQLKLS